MDIEIKHYFFNILITGLLREAATVTDNRNILLQIGKKDCVAIETRYNNCCHKN